MDNFFKKNNLLIVNLFFLLLFVAGAKWIFGPKIIKIKSLSDNIQEKIIDREIEKKKTEKIPQMREVSSKLEREAEALNVVLAQQKEVDFIKYLENLAEETGNVIILKIDDFSGDPKSERIKDKKNKDDEIISSLSERNHLLINMEISGDYKGFLNFINKLENSKNYTNVIKLDIKKISSEEGANSNFKTEGFFDVVPSFSPGEVENLPDNKKDKSILKSSIELFVYLKK